jgi:hypothetical protein
MTRALRLIALAAILVGCTIVPVATSPAASLVSASATPSATPTPADATPTLAGGSPTPLPTARAGEIRIPLEAGQVAATADGEVLIVQRRLNDGETTRVEAIELRTGATTTVREFANASVTVRGLRDGVLTLQEMLETGAPMEYRVRVLAGRWRDAASFALLDEFTIVLNGGDSWNPLPVPQTNGWEVAWLHTTPDRTFEVRVRDAGGAIRTAYSSKIPFSFALGRSGDIAIADLGLPGQTTPVTLRLATGSSVRTLLERPVTSSGNVFWQLGGRIVWTYGLGLVRPVPSVERIVAATLAREDVTPPSGCVFGAATEERIVFQCVDHLELEGSPPTRLGPPTPQVHRRALIRTEPGPPSIAFITPVVADDPRPGAGAHF